MNNTPGKSSRERAQRLYAKNAKVESKLKKAAQARVPLDPSVWQGEDKSIDMKKGLLSRHCCFIYSGDLAHYKGLYGEGALNPCDFATAASYYKQTATLWPLGGNPHHQENVANAKTIAPTTIRTVISSTGTIVTFAEDIGMPYIFDPKPTCYLPQEKSVLGHLVPILTGTSNVKVSADRRVRDHNFVLANWD
nr:hypothetical protein [Tanacetum cinerariifolium]